ncbi:MAG: sensor histidine kinase [Acidobacteriota bacterium]
MSSQGSQWLTEQPVLRALVGGFGLVVILLGLAGLVAIRGTRAIEDDTARVVREQLVIARLLNDVQAEQNTLAAVLHQVAHMPDTMNREQLLESLGNADRALTRIAASAATTPESGQWRDLEMTVRQFSGGVLRAIRKGGKVPPEELALLFDRHDEVVRVEQELLDLSERRISDTEQNIEVESQQLANQSRLLLGACFALALLCAVLTVTFARRSIRRMEWQATELNRVSWHMLQGQEAAARRFSHELHDELGQALAALKANLSSASTPAAWKARRADCLHVVDDAIANVRELSQLLRPVILDDFGLEAGLRWLVDRFGERTGIETNYSSSFHHRLPEETETHLFRITQEAFTNVARHSGATHVSVELRSVGDKVNLFIEDNGRGLNTSSTSPEASLGMTGMRARAAQMRGELTLSRPTGGGLRIGVTVPWVHPQEEYAEQENPHPVS